MKMKNFANGSSDLLKGTTIRDVYDKVRIASHEDARVKYRRAYWGSSNITPDVGPRNRGAGWPANRVGYAVQRGVAEEADAQDSGAGAAAAAEPRRRIVVTHRLPLRAHPNPEAPDDLDFSLDKDALPFELCRGLPRPVVFVGVLPSAAEGIPDSEELADDLFDRFSCTPVFLGSACSYEVLCEEYLRPRLHSLHPSIGYRTEEHYIAFKFADCVFKRLKPDEDLVCIHDYHLWALPTILRQKSPRARIAFFLHAPFPTSELFSAIPVREDLLRALLNADLVAFQSDDHARHFLSSCSKFLGIHHKYLQGQISIDYSGRLVIVKVLVRKVPLKRVMDLISQLPVDGAAGVATPPGDP